MKNLIKLRDNLAEAWILYTAINEEIFENINEEISAKKLSEKLNFNQEGLESLLNALSASGYTKKIGEKYELTNSPFYIGSIVNIFKIYDRLQHFGKRLRGKLIEPTGEDWKNIAISTSRIAEKSIEKLVKFYPEIEKEKLLILDIGCGTGDYLTIMSEINKNAKFIGFEKSKKVIKNARKKNNYKDRITFTEKDFLYYPLNNVDIIMFNSFFHIIGYEQSINFLKESHAKLKENGKVFILEPYIDGEETPPFQYFFDMNMKLSHKMGKCFTRDELLGLLKKSGFKKRREIELDTMPYFAYFVGEK